MSVLCPNRDAYMTQWEATAGLIQDLLGILGLHRQFSLKSEPILHQRPNEKGSRRNLGVMKPCRGIDGHAF